HPVAHTRRPRSIDRRVSSDPVKAASSGSTGRTSPLAASVFNSWASSDFYTLSLHDALPICWAQRAEPAASFSTLNPRGSRVHLRSEEHTSELQSRSDLVCRLLLEKTKASNDTMHNYNENDADAVENRVNEASTAHSTLPAAT